MLYLISGRIKNLPEIAFITHQRYCHKRNIKVLGVPPEKSSVALYPVELKAGRFLTPGDSYQVVVENNIKREYELQVGSEFKIHDKYFTVVEILEYTGSIFDNAVIIPLKTAQRLYNVGNSISYTLPCLMSGLTLRCSQNTSNSA